VAVTEEDEREANELLQRMDRNRDGVLSGSEISSRFSGNPLDFDRNRDGKLTARELAVRYARRREGREEARRDDGRRRDDRGRDEPVEIPDVFNGRKSYRVTTSRQLPEGLPGFFTDKDADGDGQVSMAEFAEEWSDEVLKEFFASDLNRDGVITADEALRAVEMPGVSEFASTASSSSPAPSPGGGTAAAAPSGPIDEKYLKVGQRIVGKYDKNNDAALTASEWEKMLMSPADADANRDGKVTVEEYALWMQSRDQK
jgi:Ca2+-binding EF-hand superfamily protein